jgi:HEAT repeat protein
MSTSTDGTFHGESSPSKTKNPVSLRTGLRALLVLVIACGAIFWAWRAVWEMRHPLLAAAGRIQSPSASQRLAAIQDVTELGTTGTADAIGPLIPALADGDAAVRRAAAQALGSVAALPARSSTEPDAVREAARGLVSALKDQDPSVRMAAADALRILAGVSAGGARSTSRGKRGGRGAPASPGEPHPSVIDQAAVAGALLELLADRQADVRQAALFALGTIGPNALSEPPKALFDALKDESPSNRAMAVGALASFQRGLDPLLGSLLKLATADEPQVREACVRALGRIEPSGLSKAAVPTVIEALGSSDRDMRLAMIRLLAQLSPDVSAAVPALSAVMKKEPIDSDQRVSGPAMQATYIGPAQEAADTLGRLAPGTPACGPAIAALAEVVRSAPQQRRAAAATALSRFGPAAAEVVPALISMLAAAEPPNEPTGDRAAAALALGRIAPGTSFSEQSIAALTAVLKSDEIGTRTAAIRALTSFGQAAASAVPQISAIEEKDPIPNVRKAAAAALEKLKVGEK